MTEFTAGRQPTNTAISVGPSYWRNWWRCTLHPLLLAPTVRDAAGDAHFTYLQQHAGLPSGTGTVHDTRTARDGSPPGVAGREAGR